MKQKRKIQKLEEKSAPTKKFDTSKAFQHTKENLETTTVTSSPLKEGLYHPSFFILNLFKIL